MSRPNIENRTIFCKDNLDVMRGINSSCIDLIYLDPPFNKKKVFTAPIGSQAEGAVFSDIFKQADIKDEWLFLIEHKYNDIYKLIQAVKEISRSEYNWCYLTYMAVRLIECNRVLKDTGSLYLHCDPSMSHYLKLLLDCVFDEKNFRNEIIWCYTGPANTRKWFQRKHDIILFYAKSNLQVFNTKSVRIPYKSIGIGKGGDSDKIFKSGDNPQRVAELLKLGKIPTDWWADDFLSNISAWKKERTGYPTQKPLKLLERIIKASSNKGDFVLDPFCGCATTCVAAELLERNWVGIDVSPRAYELVQDRLNKGSLENGKRQTGLGSSTWQFEGKIFQRTDIPVRTDILNTPKHDYKQMKRLLFKEQSGKCALCKTTFEERHFEIDHFYPKSLGGVDSIENRQLLCGSCNRIKSNKSMEEAIAIAKKRNLIKKL